MGVGKIVIPKQIEAKLEKMTADVKETLLKKLATKAVWDVAGRSPEVAENDYEHVATTNYQGVEQLEQDVKQLPAVPFGLEEESMNTPTSAAATASNQADNLEAQNENLELILALAKGESIQFTEESMQRMHQAAIAMEEADDSRETAKKEQASAQRAQNEAKTKQAQSTQKREEAKQTQSEADDKRTEGTEKQNEANNMISEATGEIATQENIISETDIAISNAREQLTKANNMPAETEEQVQAREEAIKAAEEAVKRAEAQKAEAEGKKTEAENKKAEGQSKANEAEGIINEANNLSEKAETTNEEALNFENEAEIKEKEAAQNSANAEQANNEANTSETEANEHSEASEEAKNDAQNATNKADAQSDKIEHNTNEAEQLEKTADAKVNDAQTIANTLADDINGIGTGEKFMDNIKQINGDNVTEVLEKYAEKSGGESLIEATMDEVGLDMKTKKEAVNHIKEALAANLPENHSFSKEFDAELDKATSTFGAKTAGYVDSNKLNEATNKIISDIKQKNIIKNTNNEIYTNNKDAIDKRNAYLKENNYGTPRTTANGVIGEYDAIQLTGTCASHAAINRLAHSQKGQELLQNNIYVNKETGLVSVYLPEAAEKGYPKGKGDGIYTFDQGEIVTTELNNGDGDTSAYVMAMGEYLKESEGRDIGKGLIDDRAYEIITGEKCKYTADSNTKLSTFKPSTLNKDNYFNQLEKDLYNNNAVGIDFKESIKTDSNVNAKYQKEEYQGQTPFMSSGHAYQVYHMNDTHVFLEESNNPDKIIQMDKEDFYKHVNWQTTYRF